MGWGFGQRDQGDECGCDSCQPAVGHQWHPDADSCIHCGVVEGFTINDPRGPRCPGGPGTNLLAMSHRVILEGIAEAADMMGLS